MDSQDQQVLSAALRWAAEGRRFALATVVRSWGSTPRPPGSWMALREDGRVQGSVSGGCIEDDLIARMAAGEFRGARPLVVRYGVGPDEARRFGLPCGGSLELVIEPAPDARQLAALAEGIAAGRRLRRHLELASGEIRLEDGDSDQALVWDGARLVTPHGPAWRLLIVGAVQIARYLAPIAQALDYRVLVCEPRSEYAEEWDLPGTVLLAAMPDDAVLELAPDPHTAIVALTHDPKLDDMMLLEALKSRAFYVGALGSRASQARRRERLRQHFDLTAAELDRLHGPVGLAIGSRTPAEIAVAIAAEMTAVRNAARTGEMPQIHASRACGVA